MEAEAERGQRGSVLSPTYPRIVRTALDGGPWKASPSGRHVDIGETVYRTESGGLWNALYGRIPTSTVCIDIEGLNWIRVYHLNGDLGLKDDTTNTGHLAYILTYKRVVYLIGCYE